MTFEQFQSTRKQVADIGAAIPGLGQDAHPVAGFIYADVCFIEHHGGEDYRLDLNGNSMIRSRSLLDLEYRLYEWACDNDMLN